jgi:CRISPR-associated helicase Cas3
MNEKILYLPKSYVSQAENGLFVHQKYTLNAFRTSHMVINDSPTGSGKTMASFLPLNDLDLNSDGFAFYITPLNMLVDQVTIDAINYIESHQLNYSVFPIDGTSLYRLRKVCFKNSIKFESNAALLSELFDKPIQLTSVIRELDNGMLKKGAPFLFVINPDIFYYMLFGSDYYKNKKQDLHNKIVKRIRYLIIDEFHYYDWFQLGSMFTLLSIWKVTGAFESGRVKVCLLSATSNERIYEILENKIGLKCTLISKSCENDSIGEREVEFLAKTNLHVRRVGTDEYFKKIMTKKTIEKIIDHYLNEGLYGLVIHDSAITIDSLYHHYNVIFPNRVGRITGRILQDKRQKEVEKQLIFATSTVDHGFNFKRKTQKSDRQQIDFIFIDAHTYEDFLQRLGRCGRILNKPLKNKISHAHIFVTIKEFQRLNNFFKNGVKGMGRDEILKKFKEIYPQKQYYESFFKNYGYFVSEKFYETARATRMAQSFRTNYSKEDKIQKSMMDRLERMLLEIYDVSDKQKSNKKEKVVIRKSILLKIGTKKSFNNLNVTEKESLAYQYLTDSDFRTANKVFSYAEKKVLKKIKQLEKKESLIKRSKDTFANIISSHYRDKIKKIVHQKGSSLMELHQRDLITYHQYARLINEALVNNFRSSSGMQVKVLDPHKKAGSEEHSYDFFSLVAKYEYVIISEGTFNNYHKLPEIKITGERDQYRDYYFLWDLSDKNFRILSHDDPVKCFEEGYGVIKAGRCLWNLVFFQKGELSIRNFNDKIPEGVMWWKYSNVIGYIFPDNWHLLRINGINFPSNRLKVKFPNYKNNTYRIAWGKNALVAESIIQHGNRGI